jgi:hypothetical protein
MSVFQKIRGIIGDLFTLGISATAHSLKDHTDGVSITNNSGNALANAVVDRPVGSNYSPVTGDDYATTYLDLKERIIDVQFAFAGTAAPAAGTNTGLYGICHTSGTTGGTGYSAGQIYYDDGAVLQSIPIYTGMCCSPRVTVTGTVSMFIDGLYLAESDSTPFTWTLKGDGAAHDTGYTKIVSRAFLGSSSPGSIDSTVSLPDGAVVVRTLLVVTTPFAAGITAAVIVNGSGGIETLQATTDNRLQVAHQFDTQDAVVIGATHGGPVRVTLTGTAGAGVGKVYVEYVTPST